jgi:hypothetical protein
MIVPPLENFQTFFKYSLKWYFFLNQKTLDLLKFQNELPTKMDNYIGTLYKTESLNCKIID